jgi:hypothetical protein
MDGNDGRDILNDTLGCFDFFVMAYNVIENVLRCEVRDTLCPDILKDLVILWASHKINKIGISWKL